MNELMFNMRKKEERKEKKKKKETIHGVYFVCVLGLSFLA